MYTVCVDSVDVLAGTLKRPTGDIVPQAPGGARDSGEGARTWTSSKDEHRARWAAKCCKARPKSGVRK